MAEQMKESGIQWIGAIPYNWNVERIKHIIQNNDNGIKVGPFGSALTNEVVSSDEGKYKVYGQSNLIRKDFSYGDNYVSEQNYKRLINYEVLPNDIAVSMMGTIGKCSVVPGNIEPGIMDSHLIKIRLSQKMLPRYFEYAYESDMGYSQLLINSKGSIMNGLNSTIVKGLYIPVPEIIEQQAIVDFLDKECAQIDSIAADLEKQIELLQQYKKSLITETVTKGLDKSAPMKDSGNSIIGSINCCYTTKKLKYIVETPITDGPHETPALVDDGIPFLSAESVKNGILDFEYKRGYISESDHKFFCKKIKPQKNDVFIVKSGATTGNVGIVTVDQEFSIWSPLALIRCDDKTVLQKFIYYCVSSNYFKHEIEQAWSYGTQQNIGMGVIENLTVVIPPIDEQKRIVHYLDDVLASMDEMTIDKTKQLEIIQQHKKSLIYEYVTGKKRVKEVR